MLYDHHSYLIQHMFFIILKGNSVPVQSLPIPPPAWIWRLAICFLSLWICLFWIFHISGIIQHVTFCVWPLSIMYLRFIPVVAYISSSFCVFLSW